MLQGDPIWAPRKVHQQEVFWPAEVMEHVQAEPTNIIVEFLGDSSRQQETVRKCSTFPFTQHYHHLSSQLDTPAWHSAVQEACELAGWTTDTDNDSSMTSPSFPPVISKARPSHTSGFSRSRVIGDLAISLGSRLRIRGSDQIHHKLRVYAFTEATIVDVPVHPNTWYGVRLFDGKEVKIRRSSFDLLSDDSVMVRSSPCACPIFSGNILEPTISDAPDFS